MTIRKVTLPSFTTLGITLGIALVVVLSTTLLHAQSGAEPQDARKMAAGQGGGLLDVLERLKQQQAERLEGSWAGVVTIAVPPGVPQPPPFRVYFTVARGGALMGTDSRRPFSVGHGAWAHLGGDEFAFTSIQELFDGMGNFTGTFKGRGKVTVTGPNQFVGVTNAEQRNAAGEIILQGCSTVRAERITVEPLAERCQSIEPPR